MQTSTKNRKRSDRSIGETGERLGPEILDLEQRADLSPGAVGNDQGARPGQRLQAGCEVWRLADDARSCAAPAPIRSPTTRPVAMPIRTFNSSDVASRLTPSITASPARTARSASSSCASG
jgi:hypothetical protein